MENFVIGIIGRSFGVAGFVHVHSTSGETDHFIGLAQMNIRRGNMHKTLDVESLNLKGSGRLHVKFSGIDTPEDVRRYTGWEIVASRDNAAPLRKDEHYIGDLRGCVLVADGKEFGHIRDIVDGPGGLLVDVTHGSESYLVPYENRYFGDVDLVNRTVELVAPWIFQ